MTNSKTIRAMLEDLHQEQLSLARHSEALGKLSTQLYIDLLTTLEKEDILDSHDCHLSPEDGCMCSELSHIEVEQDLQKQEDERVTNDRT